MIVLSPSLLAADLLFLGEELDSVVSAGLGDVHIDVMDGNFVPNISYGVNMAHAVRRHGQLKFDCHLMVAEPQKHVADFARSGPGLITVHYEATHHLHRLVYAIKELGVQAGVSLNPATPVDVLKCIIHDLDAVLLMTVNPGFSGQKFIPSVLTKISAVRELALTHGRDIAIQVDGGITLETAKLCLAEGATHLVAGVSFFQSPDRRAFAASVLEAGKNRG
ncbi:MAG: Ribulose-phosphate 3-epimerase [Firmicutes bacterium]|nr:Ribulose-phosphate 3-epimerase [candidate division NPL-UPA2 bacterium]